MGNELLERSTPSVNLSAFTLEAPINKQCERGPAEGSTPVQKTSSWKPDLALRERKRLQTYMSHFVDPWSVVSERTKQRERENVSFLDVGERWAEFQSGGAAQQVQTHVVLLSLSRRVKDVS